MNYLAHLYLADITETSLVGSFLGDFIKGRLADCQLPDSERFGIYLHRKVDVFTDQHPTVVQSRSRVSKLRRRFAGIIVDLAFDYCLAKYWHEYSDKPLNDFVHVFYRQLEGQRNLLPESGQRIAPHLIAGNWLQNYQDLSGIAFALNGISRRYKNRYQRDNPLLNSIEEIRRNEMALLNDFRQFFPQLIAYTHDMASQQDRDWQAMN